MLQEQQQANLMILHTVNITELCFWKDIDMSWTYREDKSGMAWWCTNLKIVVRNVIVLDSSVTAEASMEHLEMNFLCLKHI